jgi:uncharacterized iron-regulated membrane protein
MIFKKIIGKIHLWLGFASGLVVFVLSITGCILAFQQEIEEFLFPYHHINKPVVAKFLSPVTLKSIAEKELPGKPANGITYRERNKSAMIYFYGGNPEYYFVAHVNPYTGKLLAMEDVEHSFFHFILHGHYYLWLPENIGKPAAASATLIFFTMLLSGIILWFPRTKGSVNQRFKINWKARWRRKNYDLHNVLGFYILLIGLTLSITGLVMGFEWFAKSFYWTTSGGKTLHDYKEPTSDSTKRNIQPVHPNPVEEVWQKFNSRLRKEEGIYIGFPLLSSSPINVFVNHRPGTYYKTDYYFFDRHTLKELPAKGPYSGRYNEAGFADKLHRMNYDIHIGAILGLAGKVLVFCASLICATLPITGFIIWWGRRKKTGRIKN